MAVSTIDPNGLNIGQIGGRRNLIINGAMQVAQRATSVSSTTASGYQTVDRFRVNGSGGTYNQSQQTVTVGGESGLPSQFTKFLRHECTSGNDNHLIMTRIEDVANFQGDMVLSFYAKGSNPSTLGNLSLRFQQNFGSGGSADVYTDIQDLTLTSTWQRFTFNITFPSISGKTVGTGSFGNILFGQATDTSTDAWTLDFTGVQLEVGDVATPFEHRSYGEELSACQRYFQKWEGSNTLGAGLWFSANQVLGDFRFIKTMRTSPTISVSSADFCKGYLAAGSSNSNDSSTPFDTISTNSARFNLNMVSTGTIGQGCMIQLNTSEYINVDAEL